MLKLLYKTNLSNCGLISDVLQDFVISEWVYFERYVGSYMSCHTSIYETILGHVIKRASGMLYNVYKSVTFTPGRNELPYFSKIHFFGVFSCMKL